MPMPGSLRAQCSLDQLAVALVVGALASACAGGDEGSGALPELDRAQFQSSVYPVLLRDCAFSECHGAEHRFFQVYGPGRVRLDPALSANDPATAPEIELSYERARSMLATDARIEDSLLLRKPLEIAAGGQGHEGTDALGRNVYATRADPGYAALVGWATAPAGAP